MKFNILPFLGIIPSLAFAGQISFFDSNINFWDKSENKPLLPSQESPAPAESKDAKFPWKNYLDPKNKEFFKEGDYTPPEPFMEIARNPSDENIKNWFEFMKRKNELARRLDERVREYLIKNGQKEVAVTIPQSRQPKLETTSKQAANIPFDAERFKVRMYFESTCPHCRRMFRVLKRLQEEGVEVHALQVDRGPVPEDEKIVPLGIATKAEIKKHGINGVPFIIVADTKTKSLLPPIQGYHDFEDVIQLLKSVSL